MPIAFNCSKGSDRNFSSTGVLTQAAAVPVLLAAVPVLLAVELVLLIAVPRFRARAPADLAA